MSYNSFDNPKLKWKPRSEIYSNSTGTNTFDPKLIRAVSYNWWCYVKVINGLVVFNDYNYSPSTSSHQSICKERLRDHNIKIDLFVYQSQCLDRGIDLETLFRDAMELQIAGERSNRSLLNAMNDLNEAQVLLLELDDLQKTIKEKLTKTKRKEIELQMRESEKRRLENQREENKAKREAMKPKLDALKEDIENTDNITLFENLTDLSEVSHV